MMGNTRTLVLRARDSDAPLAERHEAFAGLVQSFQDMAYVCAYAILGDSQLAEDAAQEAFVSAWQKLSQLRQPDAFPGWLRRIVRSECNRLTRGQRPRLTSFDDDVDLTSILDSPQTEVERKELRNAVHSAIEKLPENHRLVVVLFYLKELSQREISALLEVPMTTVAKRLYSARGRLTELMTKELKQEFLAHRPSRSRSFAEKVAAGLFDDCVGTYRYVKRPEITVLIKREGNKLISEAAGQRNELFSENDSENELSTLEFDGRGRLLRDAQGHVTHFVYYEFGREMGVARKIG